LHSCGYFGDVIEDVIEDMCYDGRHSYEDIICPVEEAYERLAGRIAVLGGIDMDFMVRHSPEEIHARSTAMLERSHGRGYYFLGTGNSVPEYVPFDNYMAMVNAAHDWRDD
jgi:uroporphyrinogen decarboxylase